MTPTTDDVAGLVAGLRRYVGYSRTNYPSDICSKAADLIEAQAKALREAEKVLDALISATDNLAHFSNSSMADWAIDAARAFLKGSAS